MKKCSQQDLSLKSYFLGPQAENSHFLQTSFLEVLSQYCDWRKNLFQDDGSAISRQDQLEPRFLKNQKELQFLMEQLSKEFQAEIPQFSPRYLGHMFSELTLPGLLGHFVALLHNPNNISKESSRVGLNIEEEVIQILYRMFNWRSGFGHLTSGGTVANLEALLRMRSRVPMHSWPKAKLLTSSAAHYSWKKNLNILGFPDSSLVEIPLDSQGRICIKSLNQILSKNIDPLLGVVSLFGSTERGTIDNIHEINLAIQRHSQNSKLWHHVDAAYGGFFACVTTSQKSNLNKQIRALKNVDSLTLDPHKLGYIPYGCGAFLCKKKQDYFYAQVNAPYIQFKSAQEVGVQSVEGSRPATGAAATWLTAHTLGFTSDGLGRVLERNLMAKKTFEKKLKLRIKGIILTHGLDLNILCWTVPSKARLLSKSNKQVDKLFQKLPHMQHPYFISKTSIPLEKNQWLVDQLRAAKIKIDSPTCQLVRMTLMNPFLLTKETKTSYLDGFLESVQEIIGGV